MHYCVFESSLQSGLEGLLTSSRSSVMSSSVECPLCSSRVDVPARASADLVLSKHMDRCLRRQNTCGAAATASTGAAGSSGSSRKKSYREMGSDEEGEEPEEWRKGEKGDGGGDDDFVHAYNDYDDELFTLYDEEEEEAVFDDFDNASVASRAANGSKKVKASSREQRPAATNRSSNIGRDPDSRGYMGRVREEKAELADDWEDSAYNWRLISRATSVHRDDNNNIEEEIIPTAFNSKVHRSTWNMMHEYQREGCRWMYGLFRDGVGGILGDEMGLGKTIQLCVHFGSLGRLKADSRSAGGPAAIFLVVCPATILHHWVREFHKWEPEMRCVVLHNMSKTGSELLGHFSGQQGVELVLRKLQRKEKTRALVVLVTYEGLKRYKDSLLLIEWTGVALDEGQKIRNPNAEISRVAKLLPTFHRVILSGTPIQNSLLELWSLFDFIYPGRLGSLPAFENEFALPIRTGGYANASRLQAEIAVQTASMLQRIVKPYLLRRRKDDLIETTKLPKKVEHVLFCKLTSRQRRLYQDILDSDEVSAVLSNRMSAFRAITNLRKLCNHPDLVHINGNNNRHQSASHKGGNGSTTSIGKGGRDTSAGNRTGNWKSVITATNGRKEEGAHFKRRRTADGFGDHSSDDSDNDVHDPALFGGKICWEDSAKLVVLRKILPLWFSEGHKVILFSQTQSMLNIIEKMLKAEYDFPYMRLDGSTLVSKRSGIIDTFNNDPNVFLIILTTRTGGLGISLTAANRVILVDPDWNPQTDIQARERAWRLGQERDVTIYRLITRGTIEEKIYQRQIFKLLLCNRILDKPRQKAWFSKTDVRDLFELSDRDSHGDGSADLHLPRAGAVTIESADHTSSSSSAVASAAQPTSAPPVGLTPFIDYSGEERVIANMDFSDVFDSYELLDASDYAEQVISDRIREEEEAEKNEALLAKALKDIASTGNGGNSGGDSDALNSTEEVLVLDGEEDFSGNECDKKLLFALFNGQEISGVYDHNFFEPHSDTAAASSENLQRVRARAGRAVDQAMRHIEQSVASSNSIHTSLMAHNNSSSSSSGAVTAPPAALFGNRFGGGGTSSVLLSNLSAQKNAAASGAGGSSPFARVSQPLSQAPPASGSSSSSSMPPPRRVAASGAPFGIVAPAAPAARRAETFEEKIARRLRTLFGSTGRKGGVDTDHILQRFTDIQDQYAPIFREQLRVVAVLRDGKWYRRDSDE